MIALTQAAFKKLPEYSMTVPSGGIPGKQWKSNKGWRREDEDDWYLEEYYEKPGDTEYVHIKRMKIVIRTVGLQASEVMSSREWGQLATDFRANRKAEESAHV